MKSVFVLAVLAATLAAALPANDWNKPCFNGECAYDLLASDKGSGTLKINGPANLIADITPAAGWVILNCDPQALTQDIRLVCKDVNEEAAGCSHLFRDGGPVNKLVRLPESCSGAPFARIAHHAISQDQTISAATYPQLQSRGDTLRQVHTITIDTNFDAVSGTRPGTISFILQLTNFPAGDLDLSTTQAGIHARDEDAFVHKSLATIAQWDINTKKTAHIRYDKTVNILNIKQSCPPVEASLKVDVSCKASFDVSVGIIASGSIFPPSVSRLGVYAGVEKAEFGGSIALDASLSGRINAGEKLLFQLGLPGLSLPGIFSLGPSFEVRAKGEASLQLRAHAEVGVNYHIEKVGLFFPASAGKSTGNFLIRDTPLKLSASAGIAAKGELTGHIIARLLFGLNFFSIAKANVYIAGDASATLDIEGHAKADASTEARRSYSPPYSDRGDVAARTPDDISFAGCVGLKGALNIKAGAEGSIFGLWNPNASFTIYDHKFLIFKACIGAAAKRSPNRFSSLEERSPGLVCLAASVGPAVTAVDEVIKATNIKVL